MIISPTLLLPVSPALALATEVVNRKVAWEQSMQMCAMQSNVFAFLIRNIPKPAKRFVPDGVSLVCTDGTNPAKLLVTHQSTIYMAEGKLMGTVEDRMDCNLNCVKMVIAGAIIGAIVAAVVVAVVAAAGVFTGGGAWVAIGVGMAAGAGGALAGAGIGQLTSMIPCICACLTNVPWIPTHPYVKAESLQTLVETSRLKCFLGGEIMIFYSPEAAQKRADINSKQMWLDLGLTVIGGALLGATAAGIGSFAYGFGVACSAGSAGGAGLLGGFKAGIAYLSGGGLNLAGSYISGQLIISELKEAAYKRISIDEESTLYEYKEGTVINESIKERGVDTYFPPSTQQNATDDFKEGQEGVTNVTGTDLGSTGGVYPGDDGLWGSDDFVSAATNPTLRGYGKYLGSQFGQGFVSSFKLVGKGNGINRLFFGLDFLIDGYTMLRSKLLKDSINEFADSLDKEEEAKANIKVLENNI